MPHLSEIVALVVSSAVIAYICHRVRVPPIVGFLLAGVTIGPSALGLVREAELIDAAAEAGVILLLFTLGIEFSFDRLARIQRFIFVGGGLQMALAGGATMLVLAAFGVDWRTGFFTGSLVALSSTVLCLKILESTHETTTQKGQVALGILVFQDLAIVALVLLVPLMGGSGGTAADVAGRVAVAVAIIFAVVTIARRIMPGLLDRVARTCSQEIFLLTIIAICVGTAWLTSLAGVSLSLGAFLAGLVVSESRYSHHAFAEILPLQILFSAVFFISIGLLLDLGFLLGNLPLIAAVVAGISILKIVTTGAAAMILRVPFATAAGAALLLAQIGEFSFVLERAGRSAGLHPAGMAGIGGQVFIAAAVLLMVFTPLLARASKIIETRAASPASAPDEAASDGAGVDLQHHVIVAGYGSGARYLTRVLRDSGIPFVIVTLSPAGAAEADGEGLPALIGDYSRRTILDLAGIERAKLLVIPDDSAEVARRVARVARLENPTLHIVVRTRANEDVDALLADGADEVLVDELEVGIQLFTHVLGDYRVPAAEIEDHVETVRAGGYAVLRGAISEVPVVVCRDLDEACFDTRTFTVRGGPAARGMSVETFAATSGVQIESVSRDGKEIVVPSAGIQLQSGDRMRARGTAEAFRAAASLLRDGGPSVLHDPGAGGTRIVSLTPAQRATAGCEHVRSARAEIATDAIGCEECLRLGDSWVHLRICMTCGRVGCCDSSKNRHATKHFEETSHPVIRSFQPGEAWAWCYPDKLTL